MASVINTTNAAHASGSKRKRNGNSHNVCRKPKSETKTKRKMKHNPTEESARRRVDSNRFNNA